MKRCPNCQMEKDFSCFSSNKTRPSGLNSWCRECSKQACKKHYNANKSSRIKDAADRREKQKKFLKEYVLSLDPKCQNCGESEFICLDYHHVDPKKKKKNVSSIIHCGHSFELLKSELEKCIILCSNCHRKYHAGLLELIDPCGIRTQPN